MGDRCFELLKAHRQDRDAMYRSQVEEITRLRGCDWEGLPPPPVFTLERQKAADTNQKDPGTAPVPSSSGLSNADPGPQIHQPPKPEHMTASGTEIVPPSPNTQSPSTDIASTLSDFAVPDTSKDESPVDPTNPTPHDMFYLEDGSVEVLCTNTLFRVHTSTLSFHSLALRQIFSQTNLATMESPNGCPRILSSDDANDFATLLKVVYLPGFPERNEVPDFNTFSSIPRMATKCELSTVRPQLLEAIRGAYPESFEELGSSKSHGESIFSGPMPHPNAVLRLFVQQKLISSLPMAYYMAAQRGLDSLMGRDVPENSTLPLDILRPAIRGLMILRELELSEVHRLVLGPRKFRCLASCPRDVVPGSREEIIDQIVGPSRSGTRILRVPSLDAVGSDAFCENCVKGWEVGLEELRKKAWSTLPDAFGLWS